MVALRFSTVIGDDRRVVIDLPEGTPPGLVTVVIELERMPTRDELLAMPSDERDLWLEKAAAAAEHLYRTDPELTATAETIDLYDYPDA